MAVETLKQSGYTVFDACQVLGFSRSNYYQYQKLQPLEKSLVKIKDMVLIDKIKAIKTDRPFWGYQRIRA